MKEIKVAQLTPEEIRELKELSDIEQKKVTLEAQLSSAKLALWSQLRAKYGLSSVIHYIINGAIYRQECEPLEGKDGS